ncbi:MAG: hypothetical protein LQ351_007963 [Letrouitia transgressa]|nr:MAG: hypothetical protein LQ351_007963 [Letrouitia transgressa]
MESPLPPDPYKTLNVDKDATLATIRSAHRKLVLKSHPDKVQGDEALKKKQAEIFHQVQQAYEILSDDTKRQQYDDRVKLATLRAEMMAERGPRIIPEAAPRSGYSPTVEVRGGRVYEERAPRRSYEDRGGEDFFSFKPRDSRPTPSKFADDYMASSSRKSSLRAQEEKRRNREMDEERERERERERVRYERASAKQDKKTVYAERERRRDRERRKDYESKRSGRAAYVEECYSDSFDSSDTEVYPPRKATEPPKRRYEEVRRKPRDEPLRSNKYDSDESDGVTSKANAATKYIHETERRPFAHKLSSSRDVRPSVAPLSLDSGRRSKPQARGRELSPPPRPSLKGRRVTEIVEPPDESRKPSIYASSSDPKGLKNLISSPNRGKIHRATTLDPSIEPKIPGVRRSETMPIGRSHHNEHVPMKSSRLKEHDSGYSSSDTPPSKNPQLRSTKYTIVDGEDEIPRGYNTIRVEPDDSYRRDRDASPPKGRKPMDRPPPSGRMASSARLPPTRAASFVVEPEDFRPPRPQRAETAYAPPLTSRPSASNRPPPQLFAEIPQTEEPYRIVNSSPKYSREDIRFAKDYRRGSQDREFSRDTEFHPRNRPNYGRSESRVY